MKRFKLPLGLLVLQLILNSCNLENVDFNKLSDEITLNPEFVAPIAKADLSIWDLIKASNKGNDSTITKDPDGLVKIVYRKNAFYKYEVSDFLAFPQGQIFPFENRPLGDITPGNISVSRNITLAELASALDGTLSDVILFNGATVPFPAISITDRAAQFNLDQITEFKSVVLSNGTLDIHLENKLKVPVTITGSFFDNTNSREVATFIFSNVSPNETKVSSIPLSGIRISNSLEFRLTTFETPGSALPVSVNVADYLKLTFDLKDVKISEGNLIVASQVLEGFSGVYDFNFPNEPDLKAYVITLDKGSLDIKTGNSSKLTGSVNFLLKECKRKDGTPVSGNIPLNGTTTSIDLSGVSINLASDPTHAYNRIPYSYSIQVNKSNGYIEYNSSDMISMDIRMNNLEFESTQGDLTKKSIQIDPGTFDMDLDLLDNIEGNFKLANPRMELAIYNSIGVKASVDLNFLASNKSGQSESLDPPIFDIPVRANLNSPVATKTIIFDKSNSNIVKFIALPPSNQISYDGQINFNPTQVVTPQNPNFLNMDDSLTIDLNMELPMEIQTNNLVFRDTSAVSGTDYENLETADLILNANNGIPLNIDLQLIFLDSRNNQIGLSKKVKMLSSATVDASGKITPVKSMQTFSLDTSEMDNFRKAKNIVFVGTISSPSGGTEYGPIYADSILELNVVIKAKLNL